MHEGAPACRAQSALEAEVAPVLARGARWRGSCPGWRPSTCCGPAAGPGRGGPSPCTPWSSACTTCCRPRSRSSKRRALRVPQHGIAPQGFGCRVFWLHAVVDCLHDLLPPTFEELQKACAQVPQHASLIMPGHPGTGLAPLLVGHKHSH